jgi:hypothetical protein
MTENATYYALAPQLFAGHLLNEAFEIQTRQIGADARQSASQILAQTILSAARLGHRPVRYVLPARWNNVLWN